MKTIVRIFLFALAAFAIQACSSKSKEGAVRVDAPELTSEQKDAQAKKEAAEKKEAARKERERLAAERRAKEAKSYKDANGDVIYNKAEVEPSFPGGQKALQKYFSDNLKFPDGVREEGTVFVQFVVAKDGKVKGATVTDETDPDTDQRLKDEALRVINNMPKWKPGRQQGKPVIVRFSLPVAFTIA